MTEPAGSTNDGRVQPVVLDTHVMLSAQVFPGGVAGRIRHAWQRGDYVPLISAVTVAERVRVLAYPKFRLSIAEQEELLADYLPSTEVVRIPEPPPAIPDCRDRHDPPFLHLATAARADALVSGDADLLALAGRPGVHILSRCNA